jgi:hypothetical protein
MVKTCFKCGKTLPVGEFHCDKSRKDGLDPRCKDCARLRMKASRQANVESRRLYDLKRKHSPSRCAAKNEAAKIYAKRHRARMNCNSAIYYALKAGRVQKTPCFICGAVESEAHHPDYDQPLSVIWLCKAHHKQLHTEHRSYLNAI